jgi:hypothetical protein
VFVIVLFEPLIYRLEFAFCLFIRLNFQRGLIWCRLFKRCNVRGIIDDELILAETVIHVVFSDRVVYNVQLADEVVVFRLIQEQC